MFVTASLFQVGEFGAKRFVSAEHEGLDGGRSAAENAGDLRVIHLFVFVHEDGGALLEGGAWEGRPNFPDTHIVDEGILTPLAPVRNLAFAGIKIRAPTASLPF